MSARFKRALPFGATLLDQDRTRFRLFAPAQSAVTVEIEGAAPAAMIRSTDGWFEAEATCGAGARYRYRLGSGEAVPDPAARAQAGDVHGWSLVVDPAAYAWRAPDWRGLPWPQTVIYEIHCGLLGGFDGVKAFLPRLAELGLTAIELMPINAFSGRRNWGYDGVLPFAPASSYGSPDALKALIDAAHAQGMMIFLDVVYNHFGPDGNYLALYAPVMFRDDFHTPWGVGIDFRLPEVRRFFTENALYWLMEYRFDGLRLDAVHAISEPDWLDEMAAEVRAVVEAGRHVHLVLEHDDNAAPHLRKDFDAQWNDDLHHVVHVLLTGEREGYYIDYAGKPAQRLARGLAEGFIYQGEASRHRGGAPRGTPSTDLPPTAFVFFLQNHDQVGNRAFGERLTVLSEPRALEAAIALQLLSPHIPLIFMGEETASPTPFLFFTDYHGALADAVREGRRREFARFAAFADALRRETIPDPSVLSTFQSSIPQSDPQHGESRFAFYRRLLHLRRAEIVPRLASAQSLGAQVRGAQVRGAAAVLAAWRMGDGSVLTLAANLGDETVTIAAPAGRVLFESQRDAAVTAARGLLPGCTTIAYLEAPA